MDRTPQDPGPVPDAALPVPGAPVPVVAVVVDGSVAALGAARWATDAARRSAVPLVAVVLTPEVVDGGDTAASALARVGPTLARAGVAPSVVEAAYRPGRSARRTAAAQAVAVRRALGALDVALLVVPAPGPPPHRLVDVLARDRAVDLLAVPGLAGSPAPPRAEAAP